MAKCEVCGNDYDKSFTVTMKGKAHTFDSFECAIHALAPKCSHCGCKIIGHGVESNGTFFCCASCAEMSGVKGLEDRVSDAPARNTSVKWKNKGDGGGKLGDERVRTKFAWLPVEADDGFTYWLAPVVVREKLLPKVTRGGFEDDEQSWQVVEAKPMSGAKKGRKKK